MRLFLLVGETLSVLIPTYSYGKFEEINLWKQTFVLNEDIKRATEVIYPVSILKTYIPLDVSLKSLNVAGMACLVLDYITDSDLTLMDTVFDPERKYKEINSIKTVHNNYYDLIIKALVLNIIDLLEVDEKKLEDLRVLFRNSYVFKAYPTQFIHTFLGGIVVRLTLPEYFYMAFYAYTRSKELDTEKKIKCVVKIV